MKRVATALLFSICAAISISAQKNFQITSNSAGGVRLGMTVDQARRASPGCSFSRDTDGDGAALIGVKCGDKDVMSLSTGEDDAGSPVDWKRRIEFIEVWDSRFKTPDGIKVGISLKNAEKILGRVKNISLSEIESREYVTFTRVRKGITYRTYGGVYPPGKRRTTKYSPDSEIHSVQISIFY